MTTRRYPIEPLLERAAVICRPRNEVNEGAELSPLGKLASAAGVDRRGLYAAARKGLTEKRADQLAVALGTHPALLWPEWYDADMDVSA